MPQNPNTDVQTSGNKGDKPKTPDLSQFEDSGKAQSEAKVGLRGQEGEGGDGSGGNEGSQGSPDSSSEALAKEGASAKGEGARNRGENAGAEGSQSNQQNENQNQGQQESQRNNEQDQDEGNEKDESDQEEPEEEEKEKDEEEPEEEKEKEEKDEEEENKEEEPEETEEKPEEGEEPEGAEEEPSPNKAGGEGEAGEAPEAAGTPGTGIADTGAGAASEAPEDVIIGAAAAGAPEKGAAGGASAGGAAGTAAAGVGAVGGIIGGAVGGGIGSATGGAVGGEPGSDVGGAAGGITGGAVGGLAGVEAAKGLFGAGTTAGGAGAAGAAGGAAGTAGAAAGTAAGGAAAGAGTAAGGWIIILIILAIAVIIGIIILVIVIFSIFKRGHLDPTNPQDKPIIASIVSLVDAKKIEFENPAVIDDIKKGNISQKAAQTMIYLSGLHDYLQIGYLNAAGTSSAGTDTTKFEIAAADKLKCTDTASNSKFSEIPIWLSSSHDWSTDVTVSNDQIICADGYYPRLETAINAAGEFPITQISAKAPAIAQNKMLALTTEILAGKNNNYVDPSSSATVDTTALKSIDPTADVSAFKSEVAASGITEKDVQSQIDLTLLPRNIILDQTFGKIVLDSLKSQISSAYPDTEAVQLGSTSGILIKTM